MNLLHTVYLDLIKRAKKGKIVTSKLKLKENYNSSAFQFHRSPPPKPEVTAGATLPTDHYSILQKTITPLLLFGINLIKDSGCARTHIHINVLNILTC